MSLFCLRLTAFLLSILFGSTSSSAMDSPWGKGYLPDVTVIKQTGETARFYDDLIKGKIVVISFIFTSCRDICPVVTARLAQVQDRLGDAFGRDIFFVSISIDPTTDTPAKLMDYASAFGAKKSWAFLTGKPEDMQLIRHKLGERSQVISNHSNTVLIYNDNTGEWSKDSAFSDLGILTTHIRTMSPEGSSVREIKVEPTPSDHVPLKPTSELSSAPGLPGQSLYIKTCAACHTVGKGDKIGPDLIDVTSRRPKDWIVGYLVNPQKMRTEGDPTALELMARYPTVRMPTLSLSDNDAADLMGYIAALTYAARANGSAGHAQHGHNHH